MISCHVRQVGGVSCPRVECFQNLYQRSRYYLRLYSEQAKLPSFPRNIFLAQVA